MTRVVPIRFGDKDWYIEVRPSPDGCSIEVRCCGLVDGSDELLVRPSVSNAVIISSRASERESQQLEQRTKQ